MRAVRTLTGCGGLVVCATKGGYILMTTDGPDLERKFDAKQRKRNKSGVVLCSSIESTDSRHEQGVMVSMIDESGDLIPEQRGKRSVRPCPKPIRRGLDCERIMENLAGTFLSWDYRQGTYY
jgi:hypothetical protein